MTVALTDPLRAGSAGLSPSAPKARLGERLLREGLITQTELDSAVAQQQQGRKLGEMLVKLGFVQESEILPYLAEQMGIPHAYLREGMVDPPSRESNASPSG